MLVKFAIIGAIVIASGIVFSNEISQFLPATTSNLFDSLKDDFNKIKDDTVENAETRVEGTIVTVTNEVNDIQEKSTDMIKQSVKDVSDSTQQGIETITDSTQEEVKKITDSTEKGVKSITETTQTIFGGGGGSSNNQNTNSNGTPEEGNTSTTTNDQNNNSNEEDDGNSSTTEPTQNIISYETLSLTTTQQSNDNVMIQYVDTSGKTINVSVTLRTTERELFSGIFYSSMFETFVNDASETAYFIDMVIEHQEYGTISSSVFNPRDSPNTIINGVFSQS